MIQRIQTVYLLLATILMVLFYIYPIATFTTSTFQFDFFNCHITHPKDLPPPIALLPLAILPTISILMSTISIFLYKKRKTQILLGRINTLFILLTIITTVLYYLRIDNLLKGTSSIGFAGIFPILAFVFIIMANSAIKKDEELVRSADRIR